MCGRFALSDIPVALGQAFGIDWPETPARYNISPTQNVLVLLIDPETRVPLVLPLRWGLLPFWAKDKKIGDRMFNARSETAHQKPSFRGSLRHRRCLIPASGFYEWSKDPITGAKIPHYISQSDGSPMVFAGLWELWEGPGEEFIYSCSILTKPANSVMKTIHDRMPVILPPEDWQLWLDPRIQSHRDVQHLFSLDSDKKLKIIKKDPRNPGNSI